MDQGPPSSAMALVCEGSQIFFKGFPVLGMPDPHRAVKYFSLNPFLPDQANRCPLECAYCVCHQDQSWHHHPEAFSGVATPDRLLERLLDTILDSPEGRRGLPISLCDYSDPFIPAQRGRVLTILNALIDRGAANLIYITTKVHPGTRFLARLRDTLARPNALRPTVFVSLPPLRPGYEQVSLRARVRLIQDLVRLGLPCCWYLRPLAEPWYDEELMRALARELLPHVGQHVVLSGVVMSEEIEAQLQQRGLEVPAWDRGASGRKIYLPPAFEQRLRGVLHSVAQELGLVFGPVMGHRLCGTNGNYAYGCLSCARQERYCQLFQTQRYGAPVEHADHERVLELLRAQQDQMRAALVPSAEACG